MRHRVFVAGMSAIVAVGMLPPAAQAQSADSVPQSADSTLLAAGKKAKGTLRVKVTGAGTYTVKGKGLRKNATATKSFRVLPGVYRVKAPGGTVKPKKTVRVRKGATTTVRVRFPKKAPAPGPTPTVPVQPPASGPVSQFVQAGAEATVGTADGYAIHIPAGVLQQSATVTVTPLEAAPGGLPGADFRIDGGWVGAVQVSLPTADATTDPVVLHEAGDGMRITSGNAVQQASPGGIPVATVSVTSLSPFYSAAIDCDGISEVARGVLCADQADRRLSEIWTELGTTAAEAVETQRASASAVSSACPNTTPAMVSAGDLAKGIACSESMSGSWGEWGFTNTTHASYLGGLYSAGAVYTMNTTGAFERSVERPDDIPFILYPLYEPIKDWYLFPKQKTKIHKTVGSGVSTVSTDPDPGVTPLWASAGFLIGMLGGKLIDDLVADPHTNLAAKIALCVPQASVSLSSSTINCVKTAFIEALTYYAKNASLGSKARAAGALAKVLSAGDLLMIGRSFWLALEAKIGSGMNNRLSMEMIQPDLGVDPPSHPKTVNSYIARNPGTGRSVLVDRGRVTVIGTGTLFNCLARTRAVWDIGNLKALKQTADGTQISCYDEGPDWTYTPTASGGNTGTNIILRNPAGNAWLINSVGKIQAIEDGGTYLCLAYNNPVIWNTPDDQINAWAPVGTAPASCGDGMVRTYTTITAGDYHTCALDTGGDAWCWGDSGQLGDGGISQQDVVPVPVAVAGDRSYSAISAGGHHTCALDAGGKAWCWGWDISGELGDGDISQRKDKFVPVAVAGDRSYSAITAGYRHTCALDEGGKAWCWGSDFNGQLGDGDTSQRKDKFVPVAVAGGRTYSAISAGWAHTCALDSGGKAWCWGGGVSGAIGNGENQWDYLWPVSVAGGRTYSAISAGASHTCAVDSGGNAWCWGSDNYGKLGDGGSDPQDKLVPVAVAGGRTYSTITAAYWHTCAVDSGGNAWCWGSDNSGQLGDGESDQQDKFAPVAVAGEHTYSTITAASWLTCALDGGGEAWCWGLSELVGDGHTSESNKFVPVAVAGGRAYQQP